MKIYRTFTPINVITSLGLFAVAFILLAVLAEPEAILSLDFISTIYTVLVPLMITGIGDSPFTRFYKELSGYKYFRSIPDARERLRRECIKTDAISLFFILLIIVSVAVSGFTSTFHTVMYTFAMISFAFSHFINASTKASGRTMSFVKVLGGGIMGMAMSLTALTVNGEMGFKNLPVSVCITLVAASTALAFISLIPVYKNFNKKWNSD